MFEEVLEWGFESGLYESMRLDYEDFDSINYAPKEDADLIE